MRGDDGAKAMVRWVRAALCASALAAAVGPQPARAADAGGVFAVDGVGRLSCARFTEAQAEGGATLNQFAGWVDGYASGFNHFREDTFDVTPWQSVDILLLKLGRYCGERPEDRFVDAMNQLLGFLNDARLTERSDLVNVTVAGLSVVVYRTQLDRIRARLVDLEHLDALGPDGGPFTAEHVDALRAYQAAEGLPTSGLPDLATLNALFPR